MYIPLNRGFVFFFRNECQLIRKAVYNGVSMRRLKYDRYAFRVRVQHILTLNCMLASNSSLKELINYEIRVSRSDPTLSDSITGDVNCFYRKSKPWSGRREKLQNANTISGGVIFWDINLGYVTRVCFHFVLWQTCKIVIIALSDVITRRWWEVTLCFLFYIVSWTEAVIYKSKGRGWVKQKRKELVILMEMSVYISRALGGGGGEASSNCCPSDILMWICRHQTLPVDGAAMNYATLQRL
jgi:hypothetical protein